MKKKLLTIITTLTLICALFLTGCVNQGMADKINEKAKSEDGYTYAQLLDDYKTPTEDWTKSVLGLRGGLVVYAKGCKSYDEALEKYKNGEQVDAVYVWIIANNVARAEFTQFTPDKKE